MPVERPALGMPRLFEAYTSAFEARDADAMAALHSTDTQFWLHAGDHPVHGRGGVRARFALFFEQWRNFDFEVGEVHFGKDHWAVDWVVTSASADRRVSPGSLGFDAFDLVILNERGEILRKDTYVDLVQLQATLAAATSRQRDASNLT